MAYFQNKYTRENPRWGMYDDPLAIGEGFSGAVQDISSQYIPLSGPFQQLLQRGFAAHARAQAGNVPVEQYYSDPSNIEKLLKRRVDLQKYAFGFLEEVKLPSGQPLPQDLSQAIVGGLEIPPFLQTAIKEAGMSQADIETASRLRTIKDVQSALVRSQIPGMLSMARGAEQRAPAASGLEDISTQTLGMIESMYKFDPSRSAGGTAYMLRAGYSQTRQNYQQQMKAGAVEYAVRALGTDEPELGALPKDFGAEADFDLQIGDIAVGKGVVQQQPWIKKMNIPSAGIPLGIRTRETGGAFAFGSGQGVSPFGEQGLREAVLPTVESYKRPVRSISDPTNIVGYEPATRVTYPKGTTDLPQVILRESDMPGVERFVERYEAGELKGNIQAQAYYKALRNVSGVGMRREPSREYGTDIVTKGTRPYNLGPQEFDDTLYGQGELGEEYLESIYEPWARTEANWYVSSRNLGPGMRRARFSGEQETDYYIRAAEKASKVAGRVIGAHEVRSWYKETRRNPNVMPSELEGIDVGGQLRYGEKGPRFRSYGYGEYEQRAVQDVPASDIELALYEAERELAYEGNIPESFSARLGERYSARGLNVSHADLATEAEKRTTRNVGKVISRVEGRAPAQAPPEPPIPTPTVPRMWSYNIARAVQSAAAGRLTYSAGGKFKPTSEQLSSYAEQLEQLGQKYEYDVGAIPYIPGMGLRGEGEVFLTSKTRFMPSPPREQAVVPAREEMLPGTQKYKSLTMQPRRRDEFAWETEGTVGGGIEMPFAAATGTSGGGRISIRRTPEEAQQLRLSEIERAAANRNIRGNIASHVNIPVGEEEAYTSAARQLGYDIDIQAGVSGVYAGRSGIGTLSPARQQNVPLLPARAESLRETVETQEYVEQASREAPPRRTYTSDVGDILSNPRPAGPIPMGGAGGGGQQPPTFPTDVPLEEPGGWDFEEGFERGEAGGVPLRMRAGYAHRPEYAGSTAALAAGRNVVFGFPPGWGKTAAIQFAQVARGPGVNIVVSPQTSLNKQLQLDLEEAGIKAFHLPGWPGEGGSEAEKQYYAEQHEAFRKAAFSRFDYQFDERGNLVNMRWNDPDTSVTAIMTPEKFANLGETRLGRELGTLMDMAPGTITFDEAQEMFMGHNRWMMKYMVQAAEENFPGTPMLATGGTLTERMKSDLRLRLNAEEFGEPLSLEHIKFRLRSGRFEGQYGQVGADIASQQGGGGLVYGYGTAVVDEVADTIAQRKGKAVAYHKGAGLRGELGAERIAAVEREFAEGLDPETTYSVSSAAGLGLNLRMRGGEPLSQVAMLGPGLISDIAQRAARIRPARDPQTGAPLPQQMGEFTLAQDPKQLRRWADMISRDMPKLGEAQIARAFAAASAGEYSTDWRTAGTQIQTALGEALEAQGISRVRSTEVFDILGENKMLTLGRGVVGYDPEGREIKDLKWQFKQFSTLEEAARHVGTSTYRDPYEYDRGREVPRSFLSYRERIQSHRSQEYALQADLVQQVSPLGEEFGGMAYKGAISAYEAGGVEGLSQYVSSVLPQNIAAQYVNAVKSATEQFVEQSRVVGQSNEANKQYNKAIQQAKGMLSESPAAQAYANEMLRGLEAGTPLGSFAQQAGFGQVSPEAMPLFGAVASDLAKNPPPPAGGDGRGRPPGGGSIWQRMGGLGQGLYSAYIAQRMWRMFAGDIFTGMEEYTGLAAGYAPMDYYGMGQYQIGGAATYQRDAAQVRYMQGEGAYSLWGRPIQAYNQFLAQRPALARGVAAAGVAGGIIGGGMAISQGMFGMMPALAAGAGGPGAVVGAAAMPIAGVAAAGVATYWGVNEIQERINAMAEERGETQAPSIWRMGLELGLGRTGLGHLLGLGGRTPDELMVDLPPESLRAAERQMERLGGLATLDELLPFRQQAARMFGRSEFTQEEEEQLDIMYRRGTSMGIQGPQYIAQATQAADLMGLYEGTEAYAQAAFEFGGLTQVQQQVQLGQLQQQYQRGQMLAPYLGTRTGVRMAAGDIFGARSQTQMLELFGRYGGDVNAFAGFRGMEFLTQGQDIAQMADELGPVLAGQMGELVAPMLEFGAIRPENLAGTMRNLGARFGGLDRRQMMRLGDISSLFGGTLLQQGLTGSEYQQALGGLYEQFRGYSPQQWGLTQQIIGGDLRAQSWASYFQPQILGDLGMGVAESRLFDVSGNRIYETSGLDMMRLVESTQAPAGRPGLPYLTMPQRAQQFLGISDTGMTQAYLSGGTRGAQDYARERSYELNRASAGISLRSIALQEEYLWGGGPWTGTPSADSLWGLQDRQRQMGYQFQMADFRAARQRQEMTYGFATRQADLQFERMGTTQDYQRWQFGFQWAGMQQQRGWAREDWQMEDTRRSLSFGWQMEDINEALRFAGGRERRQLLRERERAVTTQNLDEQQVSTQRERQQQLWAKEDERFQKQVEYAEKMMDYDRRQWELSREQRQAFHSFEKKELARSMEEYKKRFELEGQIIELQRDHQADSLELQKQAAAIQAEQAKLQHELEKVMTENARTWGDIEGYMSNINNFNNLDRVLNLLVKVLGEMAGLSPEALKKMGDTFEAMKNVPSTGWQNRIQYEKAQFE